MIETIALLFVTIVLCALVGWIDHSNRRERAKFINALVAKSTNEFRDLELTEKVEPIKPPFNPEPDLVPESDLTEEEFEEKILNKEIA